MDLLRITGISLACLLFAGCADLRSTRHAQATSVMQFLYPDRAEHIDQPTVPVLRLPLRVGIAFVPPAGGPEGQLSSERKERLLERVSAQFRGLPYIQSVQVIPGTYLRPEGGFENLDQLKTLFDVDVVALVAYDQVQLTNENFLALSYWTIAGAYVIHGDKNDTETLMEAAVYDIASRKLLFRAPGTSQVGASSNLVAVRQELQNESAHGFDLATGDMIRNLAVQLDDFKSRVKASPEEFKVENRPGFTGAGSLGGVFASLLAGLVFLGLAANRLEKAS